MSGASIKSAHRAPAQAAAGSEPAGQRARIGFFGFFGSGNFGNDGSLQSMINLVRRARPDAQLVCFCNGPERVQQTFGIEAVAIKPTYFGGASRFARRLLAVPGAGLNILRAIAHTRRLDALVIPGTGILDDFCTGPLGIPTDVFIWCLAARLTRTPIWFTSIGAGPIVHPLSRRLMVWAAKMAQYRSYRDANSKLFLAEAGVDANEDLVFPDLAFDLPRPAFLPARAMVEPLTVGVGVMDYFGWRDASETRNAIQGAYQDGLARFCVGLLEKGYRVRLLPGDDADDRAIRSLRSLLEIRLGDPSLLHNVVAEPAHNLTDVMTQMAETDVVVATRFHNVVCALKMGRPTLSLSYAEKNAALLEDAGLGSYVQYVEGFDIELLTGQLEQLVAERATLSQSIAAFSALTKKRLQYQEELLRTRLFGLRPESIRLLAAEECESATAAAPGPSLAADERRTRAEQRL